MIDACNKNRFYETFLASLKKSEIDWWLNLLLFFHRKKKWFSIYTMTKKLNYSSKNYVKFHQKFIIKCNLNNALYVIFQFSLCIIANISHLHSSRVLPGKVCWTNYSTSCCKSNKIYFILKYRVCLYYNEIMYSFKDNLVVREEI